MGRSWSLAKFQKMFADLDGVPDIITTPEDRALLKERLLEAIPDTAVAVNACIRGITVKEFLRNTLEMKMRKPPRK